MKGREVGSEARLDDKTALKWILSRMTLSGLRSSSPSVAAVFHVRMRLIITDVGGEGERTNWPGGQVIVRITREKVFFFLRHSKAFFVFLNAFQVGYGYSKTSDAGRGCSNAEG